MKTEQGMKGDGFIGRLGNRVGAGARSLLSSAGKAEQRASLEALEPRVLLSGDHPGIDEVFPDLTRDPTEIVLVDGNGDGVADTRAFSAGQIGDVADDSGDFFRFTALSDGFVSVLAQAIPSTTTLDTRVEVYLPDGSELTGDTDGLNNGALARGTSEDGWYGFVATAGQEYYIRVIGENLGDIDPMMGDGLYTIWVNAAVEELTDDDSDGIIRTGSATGSEETISTLLEDKLYTFTTGDTPSIGSLMAGDVVFDDDAAGYVADGFAVRDLFDAQIEIYDADGNLLHSDSDAGYLYDAFTLVNFEANTTYYVRVRSDSPTDIFITNPQSAAPDDVAIGNFELRIQTEATAFTFPDDDTRVTGRDRLSSAGDPVELLRDQHSAQIFTFDAQTAGETVVSLFAYELGLAGIVPSIDTRLAIYDDSGSLVAFQTNDTFINGDPFDRPQVTFDAEGGETYYVLVDAFDGVFQGTGQPAFDVGAGQFDYRLIIESSTVRGTTDDHIDLLTINVDDEDVIDGDTIAQFATPLVWGDPTTPHGFIDDTFFVPMLDNNGNMVPDQFLFNGLLDPSLLADPSFAVSDHGDVVRAFANGRLDGGTDTDVFMFVPQTDMLGVHEGSVDLMSGADADSPGEPPSQFWFEGGRPASRLTVNVFFELEAFQLGGVAIQVYDSNFNLVNEEFADPIESVIDGTPAGTSLATPAGVESPSLLPPGASEGDNVDAIKSEVSVTLDSQYWGGEAYYLVVTAPGMAVSAGGIETRYSVVVQADAFNEGVDANGDGDFNDPGDIAPDDWINNAETADEGEFGNAQELVFDPTTGVATNNLNLNETGDVRTQTVIADIFDEEEEIDDGMGGTMPNPNFGLPDPTDPAFYDIGQQIGQLGNIHNIGDTDLYRFTAPNTGSVEILLSTTQLQDSSVEAFINSATFQTTRANVIGKTYDSPLDAAIRVFDSNGVQVAYIDNFAGFSSEGTVIDFSTSGQPNAGDAVVFSKDPRFVLAVQQGEQYFVQVESSQRYEARADSADAADRDLSEASQGDIDWRVATGSYQLFLNATPSQGTVDDHIDADPTRNFFATVIPMDSDLGSATNGTGGITGVIETIGDTDVFEFMAPASGLLQLTLTPVNGLTLELSVDDGDNGDVFLTQTVTGDGEPLTVSFAVNKAERYRITVDAVSGTGSYSIDLAGLAVVDDLPGESRYSQAEALVFAEFDRSIETTAEFEQTGDSDIFVFEAPESDTLSITISADTVPFFSGALEVYELTQDPSGDGTLNHYLVAFDQNLTSQSVLTTTVQTQAGRTYYVVARGSNPESITGEYLLQLSYNPDDDHADIGELEDASLISIDASSGTGSITGVLEQPSDSDLFVFSAPAAGPVTVTLVWDSAPPATFTLILYDVDGNMIDGAEVTGSGGTLTLPSEIALPGDVFFASVTGPTASDIDYTLNVNTGLLDDHANEGDLAAATVIILSSSTGNGSDTGILEVDDDTDLFTFAVADDADVDVTISTTDITTPVITVFDSTGAVVTTTGIANGVRFTNASGADSVFYVSVGSTFPGFQSGAYTLEIDGPPAPPPAADDHANAGDFDNATMLTPNVFTGNVTGSGVIGTPTDSDLFEYVTTASGEVFVQVVSSDVPSPDFQIRIFDADGNELSGLTDSDGIPGSPSVTAATSFAATASGETYFILVESTGDSDTGNYSVQIDGTAATSVVFYPEGFANASIQEFVSLANPNDVAVDYTIRVYYADAMLPSAVVATGTLEAGARGGATLSFGGDIDGDGNADFADGIVANEAYAIVIESSQRVSASLSHYDLGKLSASDDPDGDDRTPGAIGEVFTDKLSNVWSFADIERNPGVIEEFLVYYNPNSFDVDLTVTAFTSAGQVSLSTITLGANRRGGLEIHNTADLPLGTFALQVVAEASDSANEPDNLGIVASISRYNLQDETAYGYLGTPDGGSTINIVASLTEGPSSDSEINLFNTSDSTTVVTITGTYLDDTSLPQLVRNVTLAAGQRLTLSGQSLAFASNAPIGLVITSDEAIAVSSVETQRGDTAATAAFTTAGTSFFFGDAFMNPDQAGVLYTEALTLYNPGDVGTDVTVTFLFADGTASRTVDASVDAGGFLRLELENLDEVVDDRPRLNFFSIQVDSESAIVSQLTHYDGFLGGGWATGGAALGLTNSIA